MKVKIVLICLLLLCFISCKNNNKKADSIEFYKVKKGSIEDVIKITGVIKPEIGAEIKVGSRVSGKVEKLFVKAGDFVQKGQLIAIIEHKDLKLRIEKLKSEKSYLLNQLHSIKNEYPLKISAKKDYINSLKIKYKYLSKEINRNKALFKENMISEQTLENLEKEYYSLNKTIESEERNLALLQKEFKNKVKGTEIKIDEVSKDIEISKINLNYAFIKAPISGTISAVSTQEGETVAASLNSPVFVNIINLNKLEVVAYVDETDIGKVKIGQPVKFYVEAFPEKIFKGKIKKIYPKAEVTNNVVTYKIEIKIDKLSNILKPEMTAYIDIILERKNDVLLAPLKCIKLIKSKNFAFVKHGKKIEKTLVKIGIVNNGITEITEGLKQGDQIVSKGFENVHSF